MQQGKSETGKHRAQGAAGGAAVAASSTRALLERKGDTCCGSAGSALALQLEHFWAPVQPACTQQPLQQIVLTSPHPPVPAMYLW